MKEFLSNDILEENYIRSFAPLHWFQMILGSCRIDARDRFVTIPTLSQKAYSIVLSVIILILYITVGIITHSHVHYYRGIWFLTIFSLVLHYIVYICNIIHTRFMNNEDNIRFYIKIQDLDKIMKIEKNKYFHDYLFDINKYSVIVLCIYTVIIYLSDIIHNNSMHASIAVLGLFCTQCSSTLECLYFSNLIVYLCVRLRFINAIIINYIDSATDTKNIPKQLTKFPTVKLMRHLATEHKFSDCETDVYIKEILNLLHSFQNLYRFQVSINYRL